MQQDRISCMAGDVDEKLIVARAPPAMTDTNAVAKHRDGLGCLMHRQRTNLAGLITMFVHRAGSAV